MVFRLLPYSTTKAILPYTALLVCMIILPVGTSLAKHLFPAVGAPGTALYRAGFSALILLLIWRPWRRAWAKQDLLNMAIYGTALGLMNLCFYMSLKTTPLGITLAIEFLGPLSVSIFHSRRIIHFVWVGLAAIGLIFLLPLNGNGQALDPAGILYAFAAAFFWALYIIFGQRAAHAHPGHAVAIGMVFAAMVIAPFGMATAGASLLTPQFLLLGLGVAIISSALPFSLEMFALQGIPKRTFGVLVAGEPAMGAIAGMVLLSEALTLQQWTAIACIVAAGIGAVLSAGSHQTKDILTTDDPTLSKGTPVSA